MKNIAFLLLSGAILIAIGLIGYFLTVDWNNFKTPIGGRNYLIPVFVGLIIVSCGLIVIVEPRTKRYAMNGACGIALLGAIATSSRGFSSLVKLVYYGDTSAGNRYAMILLPTAVICWLFVILSVRSTVDARHVNDSAGGKGKESA